MHIQLQYRGELLTNSSRIEPVSNYLEIDKNQDIQYLINYHQIEKDDLDEVIKAIKNCKSKRLAASLIRQLGATLPSKLSLEERNIEYKDFGLNQIRRSLDVSYWETLIDIFKIGSILKRTGSELLVPYRQKYTDQDLYEFTPEHINQLFEKINDRYFGQEWINQLNDLEDEIATKVYKNGNVEISLMYENTKISTYHAWELFLYFATCMMAHSYVNWVQRIYKVDLDTVESWSTSNIQAIKKADKVTLKLDKEKAKLFYQLTGLSQPVI